MQTRSLPAATHLAMRQFQRVAQRQMYEKCSVHLDKISVDPEHKKAFLAGFSGVPKFYDVRGTLYAAFVCGKDRRQSIKQAA